MRVCREYLDKMFGCVGSRDVYIYRGAGGNDVLRFYRPDGTYTELVARDGYRSYLEFLAKEASDRCFLEIGLSRSEVVGFLRDLESPQRPQVTAPRKLSVSVSAETIKIIGRASVKMAAGILILWTAMQIASSAQPGMPGAEFVNLVVLVIGLISVVVLVEPLILIIRALLIIIGRRRR